MFANVHILFILFIQFFNEKNSMYSAVLRKKKEYVWQLHKCFITVNHVTFVTLLSPMPLPNLSHPNLPPPTQSLIYPYLTYPYSYPYVTLPNLPIPLLLPLSNPTWRTPTLTFPYPFWRVCHVHNGCSSIKMSRWTTGQLLIWTVALCCVCVCVCVPVCVCVCLISGDREVIRA